MFGHAYILGAACCEIHLGHLILPEIRSLLSSFLAISLPCTSDTSRLADNEKTWLYRSVSFLYHSIIFKTKLSTRCVKTHSKKLNEPKSKFPTEPAPAS